MAAISGRSDRPLSAQLRSDYARFDFFQLVRLLQRERIAADPAVALERCVRFRSELSLVFPANEVTALRSTTDTETPATVTTPNYGVAGYLGPLPEALTEWMLERRAAGDAAVADFLDLFNHRVNVLRYHSKERVHPALSNRPPEQTALADRLAAVMGFLAPGLAAQLPLPRRSLLGVAGLLANRRKSAAALKQVLAHFLDCAIELTQYSGAWQTIPEDNRLHLGRRNSRLARDAVVGQRAWDQAARIDVRIGPLPYERFLELLPSGALHASLVSLLRFLTDRQVDCRVLLQVDAATLPPPTLLGVRLTQTAWTAQRRTDATRTVTFIVPAYDPPAETADAA
ncbi:MAG: type VI secretion system baseplate subunit TssG [Gammaproteobacteria bacterium]|nr:type VI secretion system baseplate subunit TssG [Gammaproteobacteria bacterium]